MRSSMRASSAPTQRWKPWPNARWLSHRRSGSNASVRADARSRLAPARWQITTSPLAMRCPPTSTSALANRGNATWTTREVAQQLLDDRLHRRRRRRASAAVVLRVLQQHGGAQREHARAGLQAAGEDAVGQAGEVEVVDLVAVLADDLADQPVAGLVALLAVASIRNSREPDTAPKAPGRRGHVEPGGGRARGTSPGPRRAAPGARRSPGTAPGRRSRGPGRRPAPAAACATSSSCCSTMRVDARRSRSRRRIVNSGVRSLRSRVCSGGSVKPSPPMSPSVVDAAACP